MFYLCFDINHIFNPYYDNMKQQMSGTVLWERNSYWEGGVSAAVHCIYSHLVHCYTGFNSVLGNYWGGGGSNM